MRQLIVVLVFGAAALGSNAAEAAIVFRDFSRLVSVEFFDADGNSVASDSEIEALPPGGVFTQPLSASIGGGGFSAQIGMLSSGFFGLTGEQFVAGSLEAIVNITVLVENTGAVPVDIPFGFIINEGFFDIIAGVGSTLSYSLRVGDPGTVPGFFQTSGQLEVEPSFATTFTPSGEDIGATFDGVSRVDVPFSFNQGVQTVGPGASRFYGYDLVIRSDTVDFAEAISFEFQDPLQFPNLPPGAAQFQVGPVSGPGGPQVPEPSALALWSLAAVGLAGLGWRRRKRAV